MRKRRKLTQEFKRQTVTRIVDQSLSVSDVARDLDGGANLLRKWKQRLETKGDQAFPENGKLSPEQDELRRLRKEYRPLKRERDLLKKRRPSLPRKIDDVSLRGGSS